MEKSVDYLVKKHRALREDEIPAQWREINIADRALPVEVNLPPAFLGENVGQITDAAKELLQLPPKTAVFAKIRLEDIQMEVSKAVNAKARWTDMELKAMEEN